MHDHIKSPAEVVIPHPDDLPIPTDRPMLSARKANPMDAAHVMDFGNLALGHPPASHKHVWLVDLAVNVYGLEEIKDSTRPIAVVVSAVCGRGIAAGRSHLLEVGHGGALERDAPTCHCLQRWCPPHSSHTWPPPPHPLLRFPDGPPPRPSRSRARR